MVISLLIWVVTMVTLLLTPLITTPEPPSRALQGFDGIQMLLGPGAAISALPISLRMPAFIDLQT